MIYGLVLAGGRSSRFGREKAAAEVAGRSMIARVHDALAQGCEQVAISAGEATQAARFATEHRLVRLADSPDDPEGPLAGIRAGLGWARADGANWLAIAPCDMPFLPQDLVSRLARGIGPANGAAVARTREGLQPLCALWRVDRGLIACEPLDRGDHPSIRSVLLHLAAAEVSFDSLHAFGNINTLADLESAVLHPAARPVGFEPSDQGAERDKTQGDASS